MLLLAPPETAPLAVEFWMVPMLPPTKPPIQLLAPVPVTGPLALEFWIRPSFNCKPTKPPRIELLPPVTEPLAWLLLMKPATPAKPPATLSVPTVTWPVENESMIKPALLKNESRRRSCCMRRQARSCQPGRQPG